MKKRRKVPETIMKRNELFSLFDERRKKVERGPIVFYFLKEILSHYGIPDSQHLCTLVNWVELFPPRLEWDREYCNYYHYVIFNPEDETDITFSGKTGWSSVLARGANPSSFTLRILNTLSFLAFGIAPKEGFTANDGTMYTCGYYLSTANQLHSGVKERATATVNLKFPTVPQVYQSGSIITCFYNREKGELSFTYNGIDLGVGFSDIPKDIDYYAAASAYRECCKPSRIKLLGLTF
jgi:hypothetical protein